MHYWISYALQEHLILVNRNAEFLFMILPFPYYGAALFPGLLLLVSLYSFFLKRTILDCPSSILSTRLSQVSSFVFSG